ncbi:hypothetical protein DFJ73DRAFT_961374 [Zopfochytrium polystomum]|nr:hypothetical protein DFJ73DRAFT_961374 [Zopfochytrium polystomum]
MTLPLPLTLLTTSLGLDFPSGSCPSDYYSFLISLTLTLRALSLNLSIYNCNLSSTTNPSHSLSFVTPNTTAKTLLHKLEKRVKRRVHCKPLRRKGNGCSLSLHQLDTVVAVAAPQLGVVDEAIWCEIQPCQRGSQKGKVHERDINPSPSNKERTLTTPPTMIGGPPLRLPPPQRWRLLSLQPAPNNKQRERLATLNAELHNRSSNATTATCRLSKLRTRARSTLLWKEGGRSGGSTGVAQVEDSEAGAGSADIGEDLVIPRLEAGILVCEGVVQGVGEHSRRDVTRRGSSIV